MAENETKIDETPEEEPAQEAAEAPAEGEIELVEEKEDVAVSAVAVEEVEEKKISASQKLATLTKAMERSDIPDFRAGDAVKVHVKIIEGNKERIQVFEGVVISIKHEGMDKTFTVRKTSWGVGVERTFFYNSPKVDKVEVSRRGHVRRAKLYYLRERAGKSARIKEHRASQPNQSNKPTE